MSVSAIMMAMLLTGAGEVQRTTTPPLIEAPMLPPPPIRVPFPVAPAPQTLPAPPQRVRANLNTYFIPEDYPAVAFPPRHQGTAAFQLTIGANGRVTACAITTSSGSLWLDMATCRILRSRARYNPARLRDGTATSGLDNGRVTWRLPYDVIDRAGLAMAYRPASSLTPDAWRMGPADYPPGAAAPGAALGASGLRVAIGADGRVIGCDVETGSGSAALDAAACRLFSARARYEPGRDMAGAAVCDVTWVAVDWAPAAAGRAAPPPGTRPAPSRALRPLGEQLNASLCPGWQREDRR